MFMSSGRDQFSKFYFCQNFEEQKNYFIFFNPETPSLWIGIYNFVEEFILLFFRNICVRSADCEQIKRST